MKFKECILISVITVIVLAVIANQLWIFLERRSLDIADQVRLRSTYDRWVESSVTSNKSLGTFMQGRDYLTVNTQTFLINGTNYIGIFSITNPLSGKLGSWIITTNKILIWSAANGDSKVINYRY
jgi:hypothetical protein